MPGKVLIVTYAVDVGRLRIEPGCADTTSDVPGRLEINGISRFGGATRECQKNCARKKKIESHDSSCLISIRDFSTLLEASRMDVLSSPLLTAQRQPGGLWVGRQQM
jgi:hypothetical protein